MNGMLNELSIIMCADWTLFGIV